MTLGDVNTWITQLRSDASPQIKGFLYQFIIALEYCFHLSEGQSLYVERYGDVAIKSDGSIDESVENVSVEVKLYSDSLDVNHNNLLNTLFNWIQEDFHFEVYSRLVIYTTQPLAKDSPLERWDEMDSKQRLEIISTAYRNYLDVNDDKIHNSDPSKHRTIKVNAQKMSRLLESEESLENLLSRVEIRTSQGDFNKAYKSLFRYAMGVDEKYREVFVHSLIGFLISIPAVKYTWYVDYEAFNRKVKELTAEMTTTTMTFPTPANLDVAEEEYEDALFVHKLKEIDYKRTSITKEIRNYARTTLLLTKEFERISAVENLANYQEKLLEKYGYDYEHASDMLSMIPEVTEDMIKSKSRDFHYDLCESSHRFSLQPYRDVPMYFIRGMYNTMANDSNLNIKWLLNYE